jgi:hypothetical protein
MNAKFLLPVTGTATTVLAAALFANVIACAGLHAGRAVAAGEAATTSGAAPPPVLIADDGGLRPSLPEAVPADAAAHTRSGRYALRTQAVALDFERRGDVVWVDVSCCGFDDAPSARDIVHRLRATAEVSPDAPVLVQGADLRLAASVANRLEEEGERRVFLVTR